MVFHADVAFALILIALGIGFWVLIKARSEEAGNLKGFGTFLGYFIIVLAFLVLLCAGYYSVRYWEDGHFSKPYTCYTAKMHKGGMMMGPMHSGKCIMKGEMQYCSMCGQMIKCKMMHGEMGGMKEEKEEETEKHFEHHPDAKME